MTNSFAQIIRRILRSIQYRTDDFLIPKWLHLLGVEFGPQSRFIGIPEISFSQDSRIYLGDGGLYISRNFSTALGTSHPVTIRTLAPNAMVHIGNRLGMSGGSICAASSVTVDDDCLFGADILIADNDFHPLDPNHRHDAKLAYRDAREVRIGRNVFIGTRAIILKGVTIGDNSVIGAGSVVTRSIPSGSVAAGNPAKVIRSDLSAKAER